MSETAEYLILLAISVAITIAVGRVLAVSGEPFLQEVFDNERVTRSVNNLLSVLFHLISIGVLTLISAWDLAWVYAFDLVTFAVSLVRLAM